MARVLTVSDEVVDSLWTDWLHKRAGDVDLVLAAGDLPFDYLEHLADALDRPCVLVPGNHDADLSGYSRSRGLSLRDGLPAADPGPAGWVNADGRVVDVAGVRIAGLGGSIRYNDGPNQWTERQQARRAGRVTRAAARRRWRDGRRVDVLLTHSPPRDLGDREDPAHRGFVCLRTAVEKLRPALMVHGHIHPHGQPVPDRELGDTRIVNTVGHRLLEVPAPGGTDEP
ncbi:metallophosphoesterase [Actinophytocola xinjiangensis]|uniref:Metallophosphoesterase n=1 Tax=Actinophytocola xinjiangensis TaxID=485602 RepID=A0A7Z0WI80_9PSEU|nr:metallophosphoesterase [Actinophytocola xinjiangensis]OLF07253.1 metallophosphoesterase [Actinophytocola xinjiangensis]